MTIPSALRLFPCLLAGATVVLLASEPFGPARAQESASVRDFTVKDAIGLSTIDGFREGRLQRSPDGNHLMFSTTRGDLASGDRITTIWLIERDEAGALKTRRALEKPSPFNADPVSSMRWVDGGKAIAFLSPDERGNLQIFRYTLSSGLTAQITTIDASILSYDIQGETSVFFATVTRGSNPYPAPGGYLGPESLSQLLFPDEDSLGELSAAFLQRGSDVPKRLGNPTRNLGRQLTRFAIAPSGQTAIAILPAAKPSREFVSTWSSVPGASPLTDNIPEMALQVSQIDLATGAVEPLISAPTGLAIGDYSENQILWSSDSKRVVITNTLLGPEDVDSRDTQSAVPQTVEIELGERRSIRRLPLDQAAVPGERIGTLSWQGRNELMVESAAGAGGGGGLASVMSKGQRWKTVLRRQGAGWTLVRREKMPLSPALHFAGVEIAIEENSNTPPHIIARSGPAGGEKTLFDPNPQLAQMRLLPVRAVEWADKKGHIWSGGLIMPPNARSGVPLVIALKSYDPTRFAPDGPYTTAFASQALAAKGIAVLELNAFDAATMDTAFEGPLQLSGIESAVDFLANERGIDREKVGLIGFSRTCYHVAYTLTHSSYKFAAATMADGLSGGYIQYHAFSLNHSPGHGVKPLYDALNAGPPEGVTLKNWLERSPGFNADKITAPLRIEMLGRSSALQEWEIYSALKLGNKPVDALYLPDAAHVIVKPKERFLSQQGNVNWFTFWLRPELGQNAENSADYLRWAKLRQAH